VKRSTITRRRITKKNQKKPKTTEKKLSKRNIVQSSDDEEDVKEHKEGNKNGSDDKTVSKPNILKYLKSIFPSLTDTDTPKSIRRKLEEYFGTELISYKDFILEHIEELTVAS